MTLWHNTEIDKPRENEGVICLVNGNIGNAHYINAFFIGFYDKNCGWLFEGMSEEESDMVECTAWTELPKIPKSIEGGQ